VPNTFLKMGAQGKGKGSAGEGGENVEVGSEPDDVRAKGRIPYIKIPIFKGGANMDPGEYKERRREISAIKYSYKIDVAGLVFLATKGDARDALWNVNPEDFEKDLNPYSNILHLLNKEYDRPAWEKADHAAELFDKCRRSPGQKMIAYLREMHLSYTRMLKEDEGTMISDASMAKRILRRSGLTHDEQRHVLSSRGHVYDLEKTKDALRLTFGDAHKDDKRRPFSNRSQNPAHHHHNKTTNNKKRFFNLKKNHGVHNVNNVGDDEEEDDEEEAYEECDEEEDEDEENPEDQDQEDDPQEQEDDDEKEEEDEDLQDLSQVFAQFAKAGKKLRSKSKGWKKTTPRASPKERALRLLGQTPPERKRGSASTVASTGTGKATQSANT